MRNVSPSRRAGFSLIELLITISIIAVLIGLTGAVAFRLMASSATSNTRTLLQRLEERVRQQMTYKADRAREGPIPDAVMTLAGGNPDLARVIYLKLRLKAHFPMSFREALAPAPDYNPPVAGYRAYLAERGITAPPTGPIQPYESAACLYMALNHGVETTTDKDVGIAGATREINGFTCYVDAWGSPVVFTRHPVGDADGRSILHPAGVGEFEDRDDPKNLLRKLPAAQYFSLFGHPPPKVGPGRKVLLSPVVVSIGPDRQAGIDGNTLAILNPGQADDTLVTERFK